MTESSYEEFINWEKKQNSSWNKISKKVQPVHLLGVFFVVFLGNYWVSTGTISTQLFLTMVISIGLLFLFLMFRETNEPKLIPEHIIKQIATDSLEKKRISGQEIPFDYKIKINVVGEGIWEQDLISGTSGIIRRDVGFELRKKGYRKVGVIGIHPYTGHILGIRWERLGYSGKETKDRTIVPVGVIEKLKE